MLSLNNKEMHNKYDSYLIVLLASLSLGNIGGPLQMPRILAILFAPMVFTCIRIFRTNYIGYAVFFIGFTLYALCSLLWSPDKIRGIEEVIYYTVHFFLFFELLIFALKARNPVLSVSKGWLYAIAFTLVIAIWEIVTDNHLPISVQGSDLSMNTGEEIIKRQFASVTFGNYNSYVTFLCFSLPFVFYRIISIQKLNVRKLIDILVVLLASIVILFNASRGGLLCLCLMFAIYFITLPKNKNSFLIIVFVLAISVLALYYFGEDILRTIIARSVDGNLFQGSSRFIIWKVALQTFSDTLFLGTGVGGLRPWMTRFANGGINVPHNMLLEILVQFGLIISLVFIIFLIKLLIRAMNEHDSSIQKMLYISFISFPFASIINSTYLLSPWLYAFFASIIIFQDSRQSCRN